MACVFITRTFRAALFTVGTEADESAGSPVAHVRFAHNGRPTPRRATSSDKRLVRRPSMNPNSVENDASQLWIDMIGGEASTDGPTGFGLERCV